MCMVLLQNPDDSKITLDENGKEITGIKVVDEDDICNALDKEINELYSSLWIPNNEEASGYSFDSLKEKELCPKLLELTTNLINRLNEINDGSYEIEDMLTNYLLKIINS